MSKVIGCDYMARGLLWVTLLSPAARARVPYNLKNQDSSLNKCIVLDPLTSALAIPNNVSSSAAESGRTDESISSLELCYYGYAGNLELVHIHERINGLFQGNCPADEPFGCQFSGFYHRE